MDSKTIAAYNQDAESIAQLHATLIPQKLYDLINAHFIDCGLTADIGCGIGRDSDYLSGLGFKVLGIDPSSAMLKKARELYPHLTLHEDCLPELKSLDANSFQNILCSAVLMHLNKTDIKRACLRLLALLNVNGVMIITLRRTHQKDKRENGKLYEDIDIEELCHFFTNHQATVLVHEIDFELKRQLTWHNIVIKK